MFNCNEMGILNIDLNCISLDGDNVDEGDSGTIISCQTFGLAY